MNRFTYIILALGLIGVLFSCSKKTESFEDTLYQVNSYSVFAEGNYDGFYSYDDMLALGDFGIGTFDRLNGEMVMIDGEVYRIEPEGQPVDPPGNPIAPLATFCEFDADLVFEVTSMSLPDLKDFIDARLEDLNLFYAIRVEGSWTDLITRSVYAQEKPYLPLTEVLKNEVRRNSDATDGTIVGFRAPAYMSVPLWTGYHLHFISDDRQLGGHLHEAYAESVTVKIDVMEEFQLIMK